MSKKGIIKLLFIVWIFIYPSNQLLSVNLRNFNNTEQYYGYGDSTDHVDVVVNEKIIDAFKKQQKNKDDINELYDFNSFDIETFRESHEKYVNWDESKSKDQHITENEYSAPFDSNSLTNIKNIEDVNNFFDVNNLTENIENKESTIKPDVLNQNIQPENITSNLTPSTITHETNISTGLIYRVQIAAGQKQLNEKILQEKYKGNEQIKMFKEDNWYKYYVADALSMKKARHIRKESGIKDAFIVKYLNGEKFDRKSVKKKKKRKKKKNLIFVVQIAANKNSLTDIELRKIYAGNEKINLREEENWYKYYIGSYASFEEANNMLLKCGVEDAFIAAYHNKVKLNLFKAIKLTK